MSLMKKRRHETKSLDLQFSSPNSIVCVCFFFKSSFHTAKTCGVRFDSIRYMIQNGYGTCYTGCMCRKICN